MAGLGRNVGTDFSIRALMNGRARIGGNDLVVWFFAPSGTGAGRGFMDDRQMPSTHIECIEGQMTVLNFENTSGMPHTVHLHGLDVAQRYDGVPVTSTTVFPGQSYEYRFRAPHAGTYHYHCHVDTVLHYARGMFGTVIVRPPDGSTDKAWEGGPEFEEEVLWQLQTVDSTWFNVNHSGPQTARFRPDAFLINGLESADASVDPFTRVVVAQGQRAYIRVSNAAYNWGRVWLGGLPFEVVASDGRPMRSVVSTRVLDLGPGERYDLLLKVDQPGSHIARVEYLDDYGQGILGTAETMIEIV
ncbi:MAG: multicopper oxidase domain-containing protein [bacterium]|nr:multicopper oxidase domain-containing protein [bacterium]